MKIYFFWNGIFCDNFLKNSKDIWFNYEEKIGQFRPTFIIIKKVSNLVYWIIL